MTIENLKTLNLVKRYGIVVLVIAFLAFLYLKSVPMSKKMWKAYKVIEQSEANIKKVKEDYKLIKEVIGTNIDSYSNLEKAIADFKKEDDVKYKQVTKEVTKLKFLPASDRDLIWAEFDKFILDSRKD